MILLPVPLVRVLLLLILTRMRSVVMMGVGIWMMVMMILPAAIMAGRLLEGRPLELLSSVDRVAVRARVVVGMRDLSTLVVRRPVVRAQLLEVVVRGDDAGGRRRRRFTAVRERVRGR